MVEFKKLPFQQKNKEIVTNKLIIELQPNEKIHLKLNTKVGGAQDEFHTLTTSESIACFGDDCLPEHGRLLLDVFKGDHSNFLTFEEIIATWTFTDKVLKTAEKRNFSIHQYKDYSEGPIEQKRLTELDGNCWESLQLDENES